MSSSRSWAGESTVRSKSYTTDSPRGCRSLYLVVVVIVVVLAPAVANASSLLILPRLSLHSPFDESALDHIVARLARARRCLETASVQQRAGVLEHGWA